MTANAIGMSKMKRNLLVYCWMMTIWLSFVFVPDINNERQVNIRNEGMTLKRPAVVLPNRVYGIVRK